MEQLERFCRERVLVDICSRVPDLLCEAAERLSRWEECDVLCKDGWCSASFECDLIEVQVHQTPEHFRSITVFDKRQKLMSRVKLDSQNRVRYVFVADRRVLLEEGIDAPKLVQLQYDARDWNHLAYLAMCYRTGNEKA